jgi:hypothetical protein
MDEMHFNRLRYLLMMPLLAFGSGSSILIKFLNLREFYYPLFQLCLMFLGEFLSIILMIIYYTRSRKNENNNRSNFLLSEPKPAFFSRSGKIIYAFISIFDLLSSAIENYCLNKMIATDFLSLKMVVNYYILLYRVIILKSRTYKHQLLGLIIFTIGILLIVVYNIILSRQNEIASYGIYIALMLLAEFFTAIQLISIDYFLWKNEATSLEINTIKGFTGLLLCILSYYPLTLILGTENNTCDIKTPITILFSDQTLRILTIFLVIDLAFYNFLYIHYLKISNALGVYSIDSGRVVVIAIIFPLFNAQQELLAIQIVGGVCIFMGLLIYNEVLIIPLFGLDKSAKESLNDHQILKRKREENRTWIHKLDELVVIQNKERELF